MRNTFSQVNIYFKMTNLSFKFKKMEHYFPLDTQDVILSSNEDIVEHTNDIVVYDYNIKFLIVSGKFNIKNKNNTKLINEKFATETQFDDMNIDRKNYIIIFRVVS